MQIPPILYKYRALNDYTKLMLSKGEIYFAISDELNDPFERFFLFDDGAPHVIHETELAELTKLGIEPIIMEKDSFTGNLLVNLTPQDDSKYMLSIIKKNEDCGIFSLSESKNSLPMYTHYADGFKGICIGFEWENFGLEFSGSYPPQKNIPRKVSYVDKPPVIKGHAEEWLTVFTTKSLDFSWEKEWRMFYKKRNLVSKNIRYSIREIIFGCNVSDADKLEVKDLIKDLAEVNLFQAQPVIGKYEVEIVSL